MSDDFIGIDVYGIPELQRKLQHWPLEAQNAAVDAVDEYLVNVLKQYPPYSHVGYADAYGGFKSDRQRKYVMARIREGSITPGVPNRSQDFARHWKVIDKGVSSIIVNDMPYGKWLMDDQMQANMPRMIGWKRLGSVIKDRWQEIERRARAAIVNVLKKL